MSNRDYSSLLKGTQLLPEQNDSIEKLVTGKPYIIGLQPGLGKTTTMLTTQLAILRNNPLAKALIIAPKSARASFKKEMKNRVGQPLAILAADECVPYEGQNFIFIEQTYLSKNVDFVKELAKSHQLICMVDEAHVLQNPKSTISKALWELRPYFSVIDIATATPLLNDIEGLYHVCNYCRPNTLGSWWEFRARYCVCKSRKVRINGKSREIQEIVDYKNLDELEQRIDDIVLKGGKTYNVGYDYIEVELDEALKVPYTQAAEGMYDSNYEDEKQFGGRLHDLQRIVDGAHHDLDIKGPTSKEKALVKLIKKICILNESCLVYCEYDETIDRVIAQLELYKDWMGVHKIWRLTGHEKEKEREAVEREMQPCDVVVMSTAGRQSRNLQKANHVIFVDLPFSIANVIQTVGRVCRCDSSYTKQWVHIIEVKDTIDTYKKLLFNDNLWLVTRLLGAQGTMPLDIMRLDRNNMNYYKRKYLWNKRK